MTGMLENKVCIVTGAGRGLGREFALAMAAAGAKVVVNDLGTSLAGEGTDRSVAASVVEEITSRGGEAVASIDSVADWDAAHRIVQTALDAFGRVDTVVNNAGITRDRMFFNMSEQEWRSVVEVHLGGAFYVSRAAAPVFKDQASGSLVHITSTSGLIGSVGQANYAAAKLGIVALSNTIAHDMARYGVRSNCISPFAFSRMTESIPIATEAQRVHIEKMRRTGAHQVAPLATYLASDLAGSVTGQVFAVRGNEIHLMSQSRPLRGMLNTQGWTPESIAEVVMPAFGPNLSPLERAGDVFSWDPV